MYYAHKRGKGLTKVLNKNEVNFSDYFNYGKWVLKRISTKDKEVIRRLQSGETIKVYYTDDGYLKYTSNGKSKKVKVAYKKENPFWCVCLSSIYLYRMEDIEKICTGIVVDEDRDFDDLSLIDIMTGNTPVDDLFVPDKGYGVTKWKLESSLGKADSDGSWVYMKVEDDNGKEVTYVDGVKGNIDDSIFDILDGKLPEDCQVHSIVRVNCNPLGIYIRESKVPGEMDVLISNLADK